MQSEIPISNPILVFIEMRGESFRNIDIKKNMKIEKLHFHLDKPVL